MILSACSLLLDNESDKKSILTVSVELRGLLVAQLLSSESDLNRLLSEFWLSFFQRKGSLRYKAFLDSKKAYRL